MSNAMRTGLETRQYAVGGRITYGGSLGAHRIVSVALRFDAHHSRVTIGVFRNNYRRCSATLVVLPLTGTKGRGEPMAQTAEHNDPDQVES